MYNAHNINKNEKRYSHCYLLHVFFAALSLSYFSDGTKENNTHSHAKKRVRLKKQNDNTILDDCFIYLNPWQNISNICTFELVSIFPSYLRIMYVEERVDFSCFENQIVMLRFIVYKPISRNDLHDILLFCFTFDGVFHEMYKELALTYALVQKNSICL